VVTDTSAGPAGPDGVTAVIDVPLTTVKLAASTPPNFTDVAPENCIPESVTAVPPDAAPDEGLKDETVGASQMSGTRLSLMSLPGSDQHCQTSCVASSSQSAEGANASTLSRHDEKGVGLSKPKAATTPPGPNVGESPQ
jgi:hypothetical protein